MDNWKSPASPRMGFPEPSANVPVVYFVDGLGDISEQEVDDLLGEFINRFVLADGQPSRNPSWDKPH
jgi:hypothetical protein